ncbi:hypothetical protein HF200_05005, partial [Streptomyces galbus]|nr:hypothetical protein [Streptomyces galbus]
MPNPSDVPPGPNGGNVYLPHTAEAPSYEEYADPAAAHGWAGSAYDDTRELPRLAPEPGAGGRAEAFYTAVCGGTVRAGGGGAGGGGGGADFGGMVPMDDKFPPEVPPHWLPY